MASDEGGVISSAVKEQEAVPSDDTEVLGMLCYLQAMHNMPNKTDGVKEKVAVYGTCVQDVVLCRKLGKTVDLMSAEIRERAQESSEFRAFIKEWIKKAEDAEASGDLDACLRLDQELLAVLRPNNISWIRELHE